MDVDGRHRSRRDGRAVDDQGRLNPAAISRILEEKAPIRGW
jgi:hypothetical protein